MLIALSILLSSAHADDSSPDGGDVFTANAQTVDIEDKEDNESLFYEDQPESGYPQRIHDGAKWLDSSPDFLWGCWRIMHALYERDYKSLHGILQEVEQQFPKSGIVPTGRALMWQSLMLENFDFKQEKQYRTSLNSAVKQLKQAMEVPGNDAWEEFLLGAMLGVDAIHNMRKEDYLDAINGGFDAIRHIERAKNLAPDFIDSRLGDGLWLYWRSLIAMNIPGMPAFADQRKEGIALMQRAERESVFLRPASSHALTYTWMEERKLKRALSTALRLEKAYPNNVINLQILGRLQMYNRNYPASEKTYLRVLQISPKNERVHYYMSRLYLRWKKPDKAQSHIDTYLSFDLSRLHQGYAHYYQGNIFSRKKQWGKAEEAYRKAWKLARLKIAKEKMRKMQDKQKPD
jgi:tetratricopeptide (TPR) repeat protein